MTKSEGLSFPAYNLDPDPVLHAFSRVGPSLDERNYKQTVEFASLAVTKIQELLMVTILEHRAFALAMQGKFDEAIQDAQDMVAYKPDSVRGYLRLGEIYHMQGKQLRAIDAYNIGLQSITEDDPGYAQIMDGRELAMKRNETRVDFIANLSLEIVDDIITLLSNESRSACLGVSSAWRNKIFKCSNAWKSLVKDDSTEDDQITSVIPYIAGHVEDLMISTTDRPAFIRYLLGMSMGDFTKIKSLKLDANATFYIQSNMIMTIANSFWQMRGTLTKLVLHFRENSAVIPLTDLLFACSNLRTLEYSTSLVLSDVIGQLVPTMPHSALLDMQLKAKLITDQDIQKLLPYCQLVRRLLLNGCDSTVLNIVDKICPNLRNFGYNAQSSIVSTLDCYDTNNSSPGLYRVYMRNGGTPESASAVLPLIRRNMSSLKTLYANIEPKDSQQNLATMYADLKLIQLKSLTFWGSKQRGSIPSLLLRSISSCTTLEYLDLITFGDIPKLADALMALPQLKSLGLSHTSSPIGEVDLIRLFAAYAKDSQSKQRLKRIWFRYCQQFVTDNVLAALAGIETLINVTFEGLLDVSTHGVNEFFKKQGNNVSVIKLTEMNTITDDTLITIASNTRNLTSIYLGNLKNISDRGFMELIDREPSRKVQSLTLVRCGSVTQEAIAHAKKKIKDIYIVS